MKTYRDQSKNKKLDDSMLPTYLSSDKDYEDVQETKLIFSVKPKVSLVSDESYRRDFIKKYAVNQRDTMTEVVRTVEAAAGGKKKSIEFKPPQIEFETDTSNGLEDFIKAIELLPEHNIEVQGMRFGELQGNKGITFVAEGIRRNMLWSSYR